jgi:serine protease Do
MRKRDVFAALAGILLCVGALVVYRFVVSRSGSASGPIHGPVLNDEISRQRKNAIVMAANQVGPAVVSITVTQTRVVTVSPFNDEFFQNFFRDFFPERTYQEQVKSLGSGVIISPDGYVLTNEHVVTNATEIKVTLPSGKRYNGTIIALDRVNDLALLKIEDDKLPFAELGNSGDLMIGEWVIALGNPFAFLLEDAQPTVTVGVVSALNRSIKSNFEERVYKGMIQTDAAINPGNSGGPLINILGRIIGVNTFIFTSGGGSEGIGFARPINVAKKFIEEGKKYRKVRISWIGIWLDNNPPDSAAVRAGPAIREIDPGSPAERAGLKAGDRIRLLNGVRIKSLSDWERALAGVFVGDSLAIDYQRGSESRQFILTAAEFVEPTGFRTGIGLNIEDISAYFSRKFGIGYREGAVVTNVVQGSRADKAGLAPGDVILKIGDRRVRNRDEGVAALQGFQTGYLIIDRAGLIIQIYMEI